MKRSVNIYIIGADFWLAASTVTCYIRQLSINDAMIEHYPNPARQPTSTAGVLADDTPDAGLSDEGLISGDM